MALTSALHCVSLLCLTGNESTPGAPRNRIGQVSHGMVLGTFNIGDQGEGIVPDLTRVCCVLQ